MVPSVAGLSNPDALFEADIFRGVFLDTRSSVVFGCFLGVGTFFFAFIRAYAPKLTLMSVFGTIALDIFCSYGPLFPFAQYTIIDSLLIALSCYVAVGIIVIVLIFPETLNHAFLVAACDLVGKVKALLDLQETVLSSAPEELASDAPLQAKIVGARAGIVGQLQKVKGSLNFIDAEFSWGKWNSEDVKGLEKPLMGIATRTAALQSFAKLVGHPLSRAWEDARNQSAESEGGNSANSSTTALNAGDTYLLRQLLRKNHSLEEANMVRFQDVMPVIRESTKDLRDACSDGLQAIKDVFDSINLKRWTRGGAADSEQRVQDLTKSIERLKTALEAFKTSNRLQLLEPFQSIISSCKTKEARSSLPLRSLYVSFVFASNLIVAADGIIDLMETVQHTASKRTHNRIWAPGSIRAVLKALTTRGDHSDQVIGEDEQPEVVAEDEKDMKSYSGCIFVVEIMFTYGEAELDPDSKPPTNFPQKVANTIHKVYMWSGTPEATFVFKYVIVSIALWIPAVLRTSAHFVYAEKGVWALIMAQTTLNIFASDQIFNYVARLLGTFLGALVGLVTWYIGFGSGNGSPYGTAATVAVFLVPVLFLRLFAPPQYLPGALLLGATFALVVGYSWLDGHLFTVGNVGTGWQVVWRRWVTVMIGSAASFVLMMLPPKSGRKAVRLRNATNITNISHLYSDLVAAWISEQRPAQDFVASYRDKLIGIAAQIQMVKGSTAIAKWEGSIRGSWPHDDYMRLANVQSEMVVSLALLGGALAHLDHDMRIKYLQHTRTVNPSFISDVIATFSIVSQALRTGEPLHEAFHMNLMDRLHYHGMVAARSLAAKAEIVLDNTLQDPLQSVAEYDYMFYASAVVAVFQLLDGLNELKRITATLVGEVPLHGLDNWRERYEEAHTLV